MKANSLVVKVIMDVVTLSMVVSMLTAEPHKVK
jgi:hypothetical protein